jgi:putative flavoprotein involved in K+ transport
MTLEPVAHLLEEGAASMALAGRVPGGGPAKRESYDVIVIGGGQAGLSVGYYLARAAMRFTILDAHERVGDAWRKRWESLRLFTPAKFDGLHGMRFPAPRNSFPTKDQMADYLEAYAKRFRLPVRLGTRVDRLYRRGDRYVVASGSLELEADHVVVAMADYQRHTVPAFAAELSTDIVQMPSSAYRNLAQLKPGGVLLVGAGNTGADIAMETARAGHPTWLAGPDVGHVPFRLENIVARNLVLPVLFKLVFHTLLTLSTPLGRKAQPKGRHKATPLIRVKPKDLAALEVRRVPRVSGVHNGRPQLEDGRTLDVANVIWCTGYDPGFDWIDLPVFGDDRKPRHDAGVVQSEPGLYFVGLQFLYAMSSSMIHGVGRDAARIVRTIAARIDEDSEDAQVFGATRPGSQLASS